MIVSEFEYQESHAIFFCQIIIILVILLVALKIYRSHRVNPWRCELS
jgi:hypothetical protein